MPTTCRFRPCLQSGLPQHRVFGALFLMLLSAPLLLRAAIPAGESESSPAVRAAEQGEKERIRYPQAPRREVVTDTLHGVEVRDPYRWLENLDGEETRAWARAQDALVAETLDGTDSFARHARELAGWTSLRRYRAAVERGGRLFVSRTEGVGLNGLTHLVREGEGPWRPLVDSRRLFPDGERRVASARSISPDGGHLAFGTARTGSRWLRLHLLAVEDGRPLEVLDGLHASMASLGWVEDAASPRGWGVYYARLEPPAAGREMDAKPEGARLFYHRLGTPQARDQLVHDPRDPRAYLVPSATDDGRFLLLRAGRAGDPGVRILARDLSPGTGGEGWIELVSVDDGILRFVGQVRGPAGDRFFFHTDRDAPRGRVVAVEIGGSGPRKQGSDEAVLEDVVTEDPRAVIQSASLVADRLVVLSMDVSIPRVRVYGLDGRAERRVELPVLGMPWSGFAGRRQDTHAYFGLSTVVDPGSVYRLDPRTGKVKIVVRSDTPLDPARFVIRQVSYPSDDGVEVPMFLAHRRDLDLARAHPVFLYGYGAYAWVAFPWFQPHVAVWMEAGGIYALPGIRGGGEHGDAWYQAGRGRNKERAIADYLAAAEWLVKQGLTEPNRLVANGGSASGVLAAAAALRRPELFGAALVDIPALDMLRHENSPRGGYWTPEFGTVKDPEDFAALHAYSPYQALHPGVCPPPMLLTVGERDEITPPWHGYKFAARAQSLGGPGSEADAARCANEVLLQVVWGEGHGFGTTSVQSVTTWARQLAFLDRVLEPSPRSNPSTGNPEPDAPSP